MDSDVDIKDFYGITSSVQAGMKKIYDSKHNDREFLEGYMVYLKLQPYCQLSMSPRNNFKLFARYYGPFKVILHVRVVAYKLELPDGLQIHLVFHVSLLKKKIGDNINTQHQLPTLSIDGERLIHTPQFVLDRHARKKKQ